MEKTILSGIQVTGNLHLGNYLGAIKNWLKIQEDVHNKCLFFLADLHGITVDKTPQELMHSTLALTALYLASGLDPNKSTIFAQSTVSAHAELAWILNCVTPMGWLKRMTQFKDKAGENQDHANLGLFSYPVLMAADILLYNPDFVPVGDDQKQHLELTRDIAGAINRKFEAEIFKIPNPLIQGMNTRVMSLRDGRKKMSKSDSSDMSRINLSDDATTISHKIQKAKTDSIASIYYDIENRPEVSNLLKIYSELAQVSIEEITSQYSNKGTAEFKKDLAEVIINTINPIHNEYIKLMQNQDYLISVLKLGQNNANDIASKTLNKVKKLFGFISI